jgi:hypothetical protein
MVGRQGVEGFLLRAKLIEVGREVPPDNVPLRRNEVKADQQAGGRVPPHRLGHLLHSQFWITLHHSILSVDFQRDIEYNFLRKLFIGNIPLNNYQNLHLESVTKLENSNPDIWKEIYNRTKLLALVSRLRHAAKRKKVPFNLNADHITLPEYCPVLGIKLAFNTVASDDNSYSVDRIDNTKGYTMDNICIMSLKANKMKSNGTLEELVKIGKWAEAELKLRAS